jgi:phenylalanyl-tRNA synthetase beta chain
VTGDALRVTVPVFRATRDISIPEDLVEEIGRVVGYDNITPVPPLAAVEPPPRPVCRVLERQLRHHLARDCAAQEVMLYSFDSLTWCKTIGHDTEGALRLRNAISADLPTMRRSLMPNLLAAGLRNQSNYDDQRFFETGRVFFAAKPGDEIPPQERHLGFLALEKRGDAPTLFRRTRGILEGLLESLKRGSFTLTPAAPLANEPWTVEGRLLEVKHQSGLVLGRLGQVNPFLMGEAKLRGVGVFFELNTDPLLEIPETRGRWKPIARFPRISYDLSFVLARAVPYGAVAEAVAGAAGDFLAELELVAVYEGKPIPEDHRSLSFRLVFGDDNRTLRDDEVRPAVDAVVEAVKQRCGGTLRDA